MQFGAPLPAGFYDRDPAVVASELLGAVLRHEDELGAVSGRIVETEAYLGPHDPASHSAVGRKARCDAQLCDGPAKLCAAVGIDRTLDGTMLTGGSSLTIHAGVPVPNDEVVVGPRVGISKAVEWPLRFRIGNP